MNVADHKDEQIRKEKLNLTDSIDEGRMTLSMDEITKYQGRVKHYLNSFEFENNLNGIDVARMLGYTNAHYSRLKNIGVENKISSTLNFLSNLAKLKNMSLTEFVMYVDNKPLKNPETQLARGLWDWEIQMLNFLSKIEPTIRRILTRRAIKESENCDFTFLKLELGISVLTLMLKLNTSDFLLMISLLKELIKRADDKDKVSVIESQDKINELEELKKELMLISINFNFENP